MLSEQRIRALLYNFSVLVFFLGIPLLVSFSLGYKFDTRAFKFTKTGLIVIKTEPAGADIYFNERLLLDKTPFAITELLPGKYRLRLELSRHYPWMGAVEVEPGKVARLEKIILFPVRSDIKQLNKYPFNSVWMDKDQERIYYFSEDELAVYKSDLDGENFQILGTLVPLKRPVLKWAVSWDREKVMYFSNRQLAVSFFNQQEEAEEKPSFIFQHPDSQIINAFWHSDNHHIVLVTSRGIEVVEAIQDMMPVRLFLLNTRNTLAYYDERTDSLYFVDSQRAQDGKTYENLYKMQFNPGGFLQGLIKLAPLELSGLRQ